jgi:hypothetical protein
MRTATAPEPGDPGNLRIERRIAWLRLDDPGSKVNTLSGRRRGRARLRRRRVRRDKIGPARGLRPAGARRRAAAGPRNQTP